MSIGRLYLMRIAVLGVGSIGGLILGALSTTDHGLVAVSRAETALRLSAEGLVLHHHDGPIEMIPPGRFEVVDTTIDEKHPKCLNRSTSQ